jgi:hypothetical protein
MAALNVCETIVIEPRITIVSTRAEVMMLLNIVVLFKILFPDLFQHVSHLHVAIPVYSFCLRKLGEDIAEVGISLG